MSLEATDIIDRSRSADLADIAHSLRPSFVQQEAAPEDRVSVLTVKSVLLSTRIRRD